MGAGSDCSDDKAAPTDSMRMMHEGGRDRSVNLPEIKC